jgi:type IV pilus assembly protein PilN
MSKINLLPWREAKRKEKQTEFFIMLGITAVIAAGIWLLIHFFHSQLIDNQLERNQFVVSETAKLDKKIEEIRELQREKQRLMDRMRAIEQLQGNRPLIVRFFDELVKSLPEGVSVTSVSQQDSNITINGEAQSNARVSSFMRNLEASDWLAKPALDIIQGRSASGTRISSFTLRFQQVVPKVEED